MNRLARIELVKQMLAKGELRLSPTHPWLTEEPDEQTAALRYGIQQAHKVARSSP